MVRDFIEAEERLVRGLSPLERIRRNIISKASDWEDMLDALWLNVFEPDESLCKHCGLTLPGWCDRCGLRVGLGLGEQDARSIPWRPQSNTNCNVISRLIGQSAYLVCI